MSNPIRDQYVGVFGTPQGTGGFSPGLTPRPAPQQARSWIEQQNKYYVDNLPKWLYAQDFYTGEVVSLTNIRDYLVRRISGESDAAYLERMRLADYTNHFAAAADSLVGMLTAVEKDANRIFVDENGVGLGDPSDQATPIGKLWNNADLEGNSYLTVWKRLATKLVVQLDAWVLIDAYDGTPKIRILPAQSVTQWTYDMYSNLTDVLVEERSDFRGSIEEAMTLSQHQYVRYRADGWQRYKVDKDGQPIAVTGPNGSGTYRYVDPDGRPALPIFPCRLPLDRHVGYLQARKANAIFNQESGRDHLIRVGNFPRLVYVGTGESFKAVADKLDKGSSLLHEAIEASGGTRYVAPPVANAQAATEILKRKVDEFYVTFFREYGDAAAQKTATQVRQDISSGVGAFLTLLKAALDDAEQNALWRIEQTVYPEEPGKWFIASVERSDTFLPPDPDAIAQRTATLVFGTDPVPVGVDAMIDAAKQVCELRGLVVNDDQLEQSVKAYALARALEKTSAISLPAETMADFVLQLLGGLGYVDANAVTVMADGTKAKTLDLIRKDLIDASNAAAEAKKRQAELFSPFGSFGNGGAGAGGGGAAPSRGAESKVGQPAAPAPGAVQPPMAAP